MTLNYKRYAAVILALAALLTMPLSAVAEQKENAGSPAHVAIVNGKTISNQDYQAELVLYKQRLQAQGMQIPENLQDQVRTEVLNQMIGRELIFQQTQKSGIEVDSAQVDSELTAIKERFGDPEAFQAALDKMNMTEGRLKDQIVERTAIRSFIEKEIVSKIQVSDEEANTFYKDNPNYFKRPEEVHAQHILIKSNKEDDEKKKEASRQELMKIKKRIAAGEDFGELAKAHSQCPSAQNGGDLGSFGRGKMVPAFEDVAFGLKANEVSDIVETQFGYHLIKVLEHRQPSTVDLEEARPRIVANLRNQKIQSEVNTYVEKLRGEAKIETFLK